MLKKLGLLLGIFCIIHLQAAKEDGKGVLYWKGQVKQAQRKKICELLKRSGEDSATAKHDDSKKKLRKVHVSSREIGTGSQLTRTEPTFRAQHPVLMRIQANQSYPGTLSTK